MIVTMSVVSPIDAQVLTNDCKVAVGINEPDKSASDKAGTGIFLLSQNLLADSWLQGD